MARSQISTTDSSWNGRSSISASSACTKNFLVLRCRRSSRSAVRSLSRFTRPLPFPV